MTLSVAFLRAVNVGGRTVKMEELRRLFEDMGFAGVSTFIASGNVIFEQVTGEPAAVEARIEDGLERALGYEVATFLRSEEEIAGLVSNSPFTAREIENAAALNVGLLKAPLDKTRLAVLATLTTEIDDFRAPGREVHWRCLRKQNESKFSNALFERRVGARITFRSASSLARLAAKLGLEPHRR